MACIGQAGARKNGKGTRYRIPEHRRNPIKDDWIEVVAITATDDTFDSIEISYLENKICNLVMDARRYIILE